MHRLSFVRALAVAGALASLAAAPALAQVPGARVRLQVTPKDAAVYVDGLYAGIVDDFDGPTERLPLSPGPHEIVVHLAGYRTAHEQVDLGGHATYRIRYAMEKLAAGETSEAPPAPVPQAANPPVAAGNVSAPPAALYGTVSIRVQPFDADVRVDGERWIGSGAGDDPLSVHVREGRHRVEVQKDGYRRFAQDVDIRSGETISVNVSLAPENPR